VPLTSPAGPRLCLGLEGGWGSGCNRAVWKSTAPKAPVDSRKGISKACHNCCLHTSTSGAKSTDQFEFGGLVLMPAPRQNMRLSPQKRNWHNDIYSPLLFKLVQYFLQRPGNCWCLFRKCDPVTGSLETRDLRGFDLTPK
jgi:hypothetical protein